MKLSRHQMLSIFFKLFTLAIATNLSACSTLSPTATPPPTFYVLDNPGRAQKSTVPPPRVAGAPTLIITPPRAAAGFDSQRIIYLRESHKLEYFAQSEWVDPPARMLAPLLVDALANNAAFTAVVLAAGSSTGDLRLDTDIIRLQQDFRTQPSQVRFTLRATLVDDKTRRVLTWREFDSSVAALRDDPYGGVIAANMAVQHVLQALSTFLTEGQP